MRQELGQATDQVFSDTDVRAIHDQFGVVGESWRGVRTGLVVAERLAREQGASEPVDPNLRALMLREEAKLQDTTDPA